MGTTWFDYARPDPRSWLLSNDEIITEPPLEVTSSKLRVRVAGNTKQSVYLSRVEEMLHVEAKRTAAARHTSVWLDLSMDFEARFKVKAGFNYSEQKAELHLLAGGRTTHAWWLFKDRRTPFQVMVVAVLSKKGYAVPGTPHEMRVIALVPTLNDAGLSSITENQGDFAPAITEFCPDKHDRLRWAGFIRNNPVAWTDVLAADEDLPDARTAVRAYLGAVRSLEDLGDIKVPDFSNSQDLAWRTLELEETNVNASFVNDLIEFVEGASTAEQAAEHYARMLDALRQAGITVTAKSENDFMKVLLSGEDEAKTVKVLRIAEEGGRAAQDHDHELSVHLPTGTFIVECSFKQSDVETIDAWNEARMIASLTGEEDALLAYARKFVKGQLRKRTRTILTERGAPPK